MARKKSKRASYSNGNAIHPSPISDNKGFRSDDTDLTIISISDTSRGNSPYPEPRHNSQSPENKQTFLVSWPNIFYSFYWYKRHFIVAIF